MITIVGPSRYKISRKTLKAYLKSLFQKNSIDMSSALNVVFVGKRKMKEIASTYKHENVALPVLAFPYHESMGQEPLLGEIFICYPQAVLLAAERGKRVEETLHQLLEHGLRNILK